MLRMMGRGLVVLAALVLAGSFAGDLHGLGDSLAVFRPVIITGSLFVGLLVWRWRGAQIVMLGVCAVALWHGAGLIPRETPQDANFTIYQKNMLYRPADRGPMMADIRALNADVVTLQEVSRANAPMLDRLRDLYPYQLLCNAHSVGAVAVLSQHPMRGQACGTSSGLARAVVQLNGRDVQVISVHLHWPWPYAQLAHAKGLVGEIGPLENGATVIGGDFNMVASGRSLAWFGQATDTARVGRLTRSYDLFGYPLGIDHVLATGGTGILTVRDQLGSDHYGLFALIELP